MRIWIAGAALVLPVLGAQAAQVGVQPGAGATPGAQGLSPAAAVSPPVASVAPAPPAAPVVPALTPVSLEIGADLGSKTSKSGDTFPIRLHEAIVIDGKELVPAGATGMGEVVEARHTGMSGSSGILILAARYLDISGHHLRLRSMHLAENGTSRIGTANGLGIAGAVIPGVGFLALLTSGDDVSVRSGSVAAAKTAEDFTLITSSGALPAASAAIASKETTQ